MGPGCFQFVHHNDPFFKRGEIKVITYAELIVAGHFEQQVLVLFFIRATFQYLTIGDEFKVLPDRIADQPGKRVIPIDDANKFTKKNISRVFLSYMHELVPDDLF